jgi:hypothetical protein
MSIHLSSKIHQSQCSGCFVLSVVKAAAIHFIFEVFDMLGIAIGAKTNGISCAADTKWLAMAQTQTTLMSGTAAPRIVVCDDSCGGSSHCHDGS